MENKSADIVFPTLMAIWGLVIFIYYGTTLHFGEGISMIVILDILPVGLLWLFYKGFKLALREIPKEKKPVAVPPLKSSIKPEDLQKMKTEYQQEIPYEIASRIKSNEKKSGMEAKLEDMKNKKNMRA